MYVDVGISKSRYVCATSHCTQQGRDLLRRELDRPPSPMAVFGLTLAPLDIAGRGTSCEGPHRDHRNPGPWSLRRLDEGTRINFLLTELASERPLIPADLGADDSVRDTLDTFRMIARIPNGSLGAYVITMTSRASDVLAVELLQKASGIAAPLRVVPLFETSRDLENAGAVLDMLLPIPWYRERINGRQEVMVGYSDSAKDVGRLAAGWDLYRAQETIVDTCRRHGIQVTLFWARRQRRSCGGPKHWRSVAAPDPSTAT